MYNHPISVWNEKFAQHMTNTFNNLGEDSNHYLLRCPLYFQARNKMLNDIRQLCTFHISGNLLLYGAVELDYATSCKLFDAVHDYIDETGRL